MLQRLILVYGGTFDPLHNGHVSVIEALKKQFSKPSIEFEIRLIPCKIPVHKANSHANVEHRKAMLELICRNDAYTSIDTRELERETPSYMIETLQSIRLQHPKVPLVLVIGADSFKHLNQWYQWQKLVHYSHLLVIERPGEILHLPKSLEHFFAARICNDIKQLLQAPNGLLFLLEAKTAAVSSTQIRERIQKNLDVNSLLPSAVSEYITQQKLYK